MKRKLHLLILSSFLLFIAAVTGCKSTGGLQANDEETEVWQPVKSIDQLKGTWISDEATIIFPKNLDNQEYLLLREKDNDDSTKWMNYAKKYNIPIKQAWAKRYGALAEVYGINYPLSDSNGTQRGIKFSTPKIFTDYYVEVITRTETLIPEEIIFKNLSIFSISKDGTQLKQNGTFRYFSSVFKNEYVEERIFSKVEK
ncbi:MAG: hypothetical protein MJ179_04305 [Treponema sp.]|nr:hypothetical protein [Treponema sp.]